MRCLREPNILADDSAGPGRGESYLAGTIIRVRNKSMRAVLGREQQLARPETSLFFCGMGKFSKGNGCRWATGGMLLDLTRHGRGPLLFCACLRACLPTGSCAVHPASSGMSRVGRGPLSPACRGPILRPNWYLTIRTLPYRRGSQARPH